MDLAAIRKTYAQRELSESDTDPDALVQFRQWIDEAIRSEVDEPTAMVLATVDATGQPSARVVLLKHLEVEGPGGLTFFTNYQSRKGQALDANPKAAITFFWPPLERQVRLEGTVEEAPAAQSDAYFISRPRGSQIGAWASPQSQVVPDRQALEAFEHTVAQRFADQNPLPRPINWGGYTLRPHRIEFWQGRPSRLHDRLLYVRQADGSWKRTRLAP